MTIPKKEMIALKLDDIAIQDEHHLVCGFTELGMVDPFSSNPKKSQARWNDIVKFNNKKNPDIEYEREKYVANH